MDSGKSKQQSQTLGTSQKVEEKNTPEPAGSGGSSFSFKDIKF
jgi:hypothetical protein